MIEKLKLPEELLNTPFKDWEHPSLRFDMKEDDEITKHIFFCKTSLMARRQGISAMSNFSEFSYATF